MILDDLLIALIIAGIGTSGAYLRAELLLHRRLTAAQRIRQLQLRKLQTTNKNPRTRTGVESMAGSYRILPKTELARKKEAGS